MKKALILTHAQIVGNMWAICVVAAVASLSGSAAFALDHMGPPRAGIDYDQFRIGADVSLSETKLKLTSGRAIDPATSVAMTDRKIKDFETSKLYVTAGYGFAQNWEAFLGIAATKTEFGDDVYHLGESFDSGIGLGLRGGVRATLFELPDYDVQLGGLIQFNWANYDGGLDVPGQPSPDFVEVDLKEMQIAVGATYWWLDGFVVYAGPFLHYIKGDLEQEDIGGFDIAWDVDEGPIWGAYIGAQYDLAENCVVSIEYQHSSDANLLGAGLMLTY